MDDLFIFSEEKPEDINHQAINDERWKILIVDDEPEVHKITNLVLESFVFDNKKLDILPAFSAEEAKALLHQQPKDEPIAVAFIDVVMETDTSGLDLVKYIREDMQNSITRIILRTGQPGQAPEESVIRDYDINDYKAKTELTSTKLKTALYASLRSFRDISTIENHKTGLQKVLKAIGNTSTETSLRSLTSSLLAEIAIVLELDENTMYCSVLSTPDNTNPPVENYRILAKSGELFFHLEEDEIGAIPEDIAPLFQQAYEQKTSIQSGLDFVAYIGTSDKCESLLYVRNSTPISELNINLLNIFIDHFVKAYTALALKDEIENSQKELIYILGEAVELRSKETGSHVKRVGEISYLLAKAYPLSEEECNLIKLAAPLHDIGKVSIPDKIMNKPGRHDPDERRIMETHAEAGYKMLINSTSESLRQAALISLEHHEHWDGNGYPNKKSGLDIDVMARITGLADVYDALGSKRCYKDAWPHDKILELIQSLKGKQFEPKLVDLLLENIQEISEVRRRLPDLD